MKTLFKYILIVALLFTVFGNVNAQTRDLTASEQWDEINALKTMKERDKYRETLSTKQYAELAVEQMNRRLKSMAYLTEEQREVLVEIRDVSTVEFYIESRKRVLPKDRHPLVTRYLDTIVRAKQLFTEEQMFEIFRLYGERETLDKSDQDRILKVFRGISN